MSATGTIQVRAFTSQAQLPLQDVAVTVTAADGTAIALRLTDRSGLIPPISIPVPDQTESQSPDPEQRSYALVNLYAHRDGFEGVESENIQIFANTHTIQDLNLIPLAQIPGSWNQMVVFDTPPQNL